MLGRLCMGYVAEKNSNGDKDNFIHHMKYTVISCESLLKLGGEIGERKGL